MKKTVVYLPVRPAILTVEKEGQASLPATELPRKLYTQSIDVGTTHFSGAIVYMEFDAIPHRSLYMSLTPAQ